MKKEGKNKIFGIYFAYHKCEVLPDDMCNDPNVPRYPTSIARICKYHSYFDALNAYANTICTASQIIEAVDDKEFEEKVNQMKVNFSNEEWLKENIDL